MSRSAGPPPDLLPSVEGWPWSLQLEHPWVLLHGPRSIPDQGWKLHLTCHVGSFHDVVAASLPVLASHGASGKVIASQELLRGLNEGVFGTTQVGKALTVYPSDPAEAVALAVALDRATSGLQGPSIPHERRLRASSLVHYRYGAFRRRSTVSVWGGTFSAVVRPDGTEVEDDRREPVPGWLEEPDPFVAAGASSPPPRSSVLADRFVLHGTATTSPRGSVHAAVDLESVRPCVVKRATAWATYDDRGRDARDRLWHEADMLVCLAVAGLPVPEVVAVVTAGEDLALVMTRMPGVPLAVLIQDAVLAGSMPGAAGTRGILAELAGLAERAHRAGIVVRDLTPNNLLVELGDGGAITGLNLIDVEMAHRIDGLAAPFPRATRGFASPEQAGDDDVEPSAADDIFAIGAIGWYLLTGRQPMLEPGLDSLTVERLRLLAPDHDPELMELIVACLARDRAWRPPSARHVRTRLEAGSRPRPDGGLRPSMAPGPKAEIERGVAGATAMLLHDLGRVSAGPLDAFASPPPLAGGVAGLVLAAATLAELLDDAACAAAARAGSGLLRRLLSGWAPVPGLFVGRAGAAAVLCHPVVADDELVAAAVDLVRPLLSAGVPSPDVFNGLAGVVRAQLLVASAAGSADLADAAVDAAGALEQEAMAEPPEGRWLEPPWSMHAGLSCLGYAHGAAGVADVLLDVHAFTGEHRWLIAARSAAAPLLSTWSSRPDGAIGWPVDLGGEAAPSTWCRGAGGIGQVVGRLGHTDLADRALDAVAGTRWTGVGRCHGMAAQVEALVEAGRVDDAEPLAAVAASYVQPGHGDNVDGWTRWVGSDLLEGSAGMAVALARWLEPDAAPWASRLFGSYPRRPAGPAA